MRVAIVPEGRLRRLADDGAPLGPVEQVSDVAATVRGLERDFAPRWVWAHTGEVYPALLRAGVRPGRCHDLALTEALLLGNEGRYGEAHELSRVGGSAARQDTLFDTSETTSLDAVVALHTDQLKRMPDAALGLLVAAESAGALAGAEMSFDGLPWRLDVHDELLTEMLGPRSAHGLRPARLQRLADQIAEAFGSAVNPDSPAQLVRAFATAGVPVPSTRAHVLRAVDHPAVALVLEYKELARLHSTHGWAWSDVWVRDGRFRPEYVVGGVVSGRWATRGGGALQIPRVVRRAVIADDGWKLVVADAAQLEPRVLAALSSDEGLAAASGTDDLYAALAAAFGGQRDRAKIAMLSAMYGGASGDAPALLAVMRQRFPMAYAYVEAAARDGEEGRLVRSRLGRTCPPPSARWREVVSGASGADAARRAQRDRGRFTRNFVVQASAADWALVLLATLRLDLPAPAQLVFFQHDEVLIHCPAAQAEPVRDAVLAAGGTASRLVFGADSVRFPLDAKVVDCYADAK